MPYSEETANRIRSALTSVPDITEKKMFGGLSFLHHGKMAVGIVGEELVARVIAQKMPEASNHPNTRPMDFNKKPMREFLYVSTEGFQTEEALMHWINLGLEHAKLNSK